jgi:hypothetical protein
MSENIGKNIYEKIVANMGTLKRTHVSLEEWDKAVEYWNSLYKNYAHLSQNCKHIIGDTDDLPSEHLSALVAYPTGVKVSSRTDHRDIDGVCAICRGLKWKIDNSYWSY